MRSPNHGWEPVGHLQGSLGPPGPKPCKSLKKVSQGRSFFEASSRLSRGPRAGGPGRHFSDFFGVSGPPGPRDPCKWPTGSQKIPDFWHPTIDHNPRENRQRNGCSRASQFTMQVVCTLLIRSFQKG